jgi:hypothetical protein
MIPIEPRGVFRVITDATQLEWMTSSGWRLLAVLDGDVVQPFNDMENFQNALYPSNNGYSSPGGFVTATSTRYHKVRQVSFLLMQEEDSVIAGLHRQIADGTVKMAECEEKLKSVNDLTKQLELTRSERTTLSTQMGKLETAFTKAIQDLADYKAEVAEKLRLAEEAILREKERKRTAYERIAQGDYDDRVESFEERDVGG